MESIVAAPVARRAIGKPGLRGGDVPYVETIRLEPDRLRASLLKRAREPAGHLNRDFGRRPDPTSRPEECIVPFRSMDSIEPVTWPEAITPPSSLSPPWQGARLGEGPCEPGQVRTVGPDCGGRLRRRPDISRPGFLGTDAKVSGRSRASRAQSASSERVSNQREPDRSRGRRPGPGCSPSTVRPSTEAVTSSRNTESPVPRRGGKKIAAQAQASPGEPRVEAFVFQGEGSEKNSRQRALSPSGPDTGKAAPERVPVRGTSRPARPSRGGRSMTGRTAERLKGGDRLWGDPEDHVLSLHGLIVQGDLLDALWLSLFPRPQAAYMFSRQTDPFGELTRAVATRTLAFLILQALVPDPRRHGLPGLPPALWTLRLALQCRVPRHRPGFRRAGLEGGTSRRMRFLPWPMDTAKAISPAGPSRETPSTGELKGYVRNGFARSDTRSP